MLAITNPCGCYTSTYLSLDGKQIIDDPSTPPVHTYSVAVSLSKGQTYTLAQSTLTRSGAPAINFSGLATLEKESGRAGLG